MNPLEQIMGVSEASRLWGISPDSIIRLCIEGKLAAVRLDRETGPWVLLRDQVPLPETTTAFSEVCAPAPQKSPSSKPAASNKTSAMSSRLRDALYE